MYCLFILKHLYLAFPSLVGTPKVVYSIQIKSITLTRSGKILYAALLAQQYWGLDYVACMPLHIPKLCAAKSYKAFCFFGRFHS